MRRLTAAPDAFLAVLVAPAGYGKTTVLAEWEATDPRPFAWLTLREDDDDPARLVAAVAAALDEVGGPLVLVLDDAHVLRSERALDMVETIAERLGPGSQLVLAARCEPGLRLGSLRADGAVVELGAADLAMSEREAAGLLRRAGVRLDADDVETLVQRTEGWPAGLYLAALSLLAQDDPVAAVASFGGDDRFVADYLRDEVLDGLGDAERDFLRRASLLDELSGPLCNAVLGRRSSGRTLRSLSRANALLAPLDHRDERFRMHPLMAETLRAELRRDDPGQETELHRRASAWYEGRGDADRAIEHAVAGGDGERAGTLLWDLMGGYAAAGRTEAVGRWLRRFGDATIAGTPALALSAAVHRATTGRREEAERWATVAERLPADTPELDGGRAIVRALLGRDGVETMRADAAHAFALDAEDGRWRCLAQLLDGVGSHLLGERDRARAVLDDGARRAATRASSIEGLCLAQLALLALDGDDFEQGAALADRAVDAVRAAGDPAPPTCALVYAVAAFARAHRGRVDEARSDTAVARRLLASGAEYAPWYGAEARIALARAELRLSNAAEARALLAEASRLLRRTGDATVLQAWIDDAWERADSFAAAAVSGPATLTTAELRVLRFLPSHLSFREIAARLHVSANTVKTQAHAVYRKLDSSSRSEAVARARDVGLIDG